MQIFRLIYNCLPGLSRIYKGYPWAWHCLMLLPLAFLLLISCVANGFHGENPKIFYAALRQEHLFLTEIMAVISKYVEPILYLIYVFLFFQALRTGDDRQFIFVIRFVFGAVFFSLLLTHLLKTGFGMPRPAFSLPARPFDFDPGYNSFPSGHTVAIITAALPLAFWLKKRFVSLSMSLLITLVAFSRLWLGQHHPIDIWGGIVVGSLATRYIFQPSKEKNLHGLYSLGQQPDL